MNGMGIHRQLSQCRIYLVATSENKGREKFFVMGFRCAGFLAVFLVVSCVTALRAQTIQIKLVDGKTGRSVPDACVGVWMKKDTRMAVDIPTDKNGVARLRLTQRDNEVDISYSVRLGCGGNGAINPVLRYDGSLTTNTTGSHPSCAYPQSMPRARWKELDFSTKEVLQQGVVSANTCGHVTASPQPGEVILFVRSRNFREKIKDWQNSEAFPF